MAKPIIAKKTGFIVIALLVFIGIYGVWTARRPLPTIQPDNAVVQLQPANVASKLSWPSVGESAVGINDDGVMATHNAQKPLPTASVAKVLTALSVLSRHPLTIGQTGPTLTLGAADVALYNHYDAEDGSVVPVTDGEQISEYQMLETMMLPSANNMADSLAIWTFGSLSAYSTYANNYAKQIGLTNTHVGIDASGFDPTTTSTPGDLVKLGEAAMQNPVLAHIVAEPSVTGIPNTDVIKNFNFLLGSHGVVGLKTGNNNEDAGVYLSASKTTVNGQPVTIVTALLGAPTLYDALADSLPLITSAQANFSDVHIINQSDTVGSYHLPWGNGKTVTAKSSASLQAETWNGSAVDATIQLSPISASARAGQTVGHVTSAASRFTPAQSAPITLSQTPTKPSLWWWLLHPTK